MIAGGMIIGLSGIIYNGNKENGATPGISERSKGKVVWAMRE